MKLKAVLYTGLMILGVGCSNDPSRLEGEREMLDGSVFVENIGRFIIKNPPPSRWKCAAFSRAFGISI
jgi:hypothetical protein